jgi:hypothetical protein
MGRYEAGETLASIARTYDCSPPAISYIVSRSREKPSNEVSMGAATELQLVKAPANGAATDGAAAGDPPAVAQPVSTPIAEIRREPPPETRVATPANGDQRPKLHLSLGNGNGNGSHAPGNGNGHAAEPVYERPSPPNFTVPRSPQQGAGERMGQAPLHQAPPRGFDAGRNARDLFAAPEARPLAAPGARPPLQQPRAPDIQRKDNGAFIDQELRSRVDGDIAAFLAAFDAALAADTPESRFGLREATDRLLRAGARTRIELERLEARIPLPPRDGRAAVDPGAWRQR